MSSLLEITSEMSEILRLVDEEMEATGGDVTDGSRGAALMEKLKSFDIKMKDKIDTYATVVRVLEMDAKILKEERDRIAARAVSFENKAKRLKDLLQFSMLQLGTRKIEGVKFTAAIQAHGGKQAMEFKPGVMPETVPAKFQRVEIKIDSDKVRAALEAGDSDALKIAALLPRGESVRIR
jgi:hypothetical protein